MKNIQKLLILQLILLGSIANAQDSTVSKIRGLWLNLGLGLILPEGFAANGTLNFETREGIIFSGSVGVVVTPVYIFQGGDESVFNYYSLMMGRTVAWHDGHLSFSMGPSFINITHFDYIETPSFFFQQYDVVKSKDHTVGLHFEAKIYGVAFGVAGLGANPYINLNFEQCFAGINLSLALGKIGVKKWHQ